MADDDSRWPAFLRRGREPIFILNRRRQIVFVNEAWEALTKVPFDAVRGLRCTRRASGHELSQLARTLVPPAEAMQGQCARVRRPIPGTATGPPWWDIDYLPVVGEVGATVIISRIRQPTTEPVQPATTIPAAWAELRARVQSSYSFANWESANTETQLAVAQARFIAKTSCHATLVGPPGVGKQTLAQTIHAHSKGRELPFVAIDCARIPSDAVRGVLLGSRGIAQANSVGTLYLSEPTSLPMDLQAALAAAIKDSPQLLIGCRADPRELLSAGSLNRDLFALASLIVVQVPPLQRRKDDISRLADDIIRRHATVLGCESRALSPNALAALQEHSWPGNLDELAAVLLAALRSGTAGAIEVAELPMLVRHGTTRTITKAKMPQLDQTLERVERRLIKRALAKAKGNKSKAADLLGVWRPRLLRRMETLGMTGNGPET